MKMESAPVATPMPILKPCCSIVKKVGLTAIVLNATVQSDVLGVFLFEKCNPYLYSIGHEWKIQKY